MTHMLPPLEIQQGASPANKVKPLQPHNYILWLLNLWLSLQSTRLGRASEIRLDIQAESEPQV